ncbi:MAG: hypothetical protein Q9163_001746 [Psora crenata]
MSTYDPQSWQLPIREAAWEQAPPSARLGMCASGWWEWEDGGLTGPIDPASTMQNQQQQQQEHLGAFNNQMEEVDRAYENLAKSGKVFNMPPRRDSMPMMAGPPPFTDFGPRMPQRHSLDYDPMRPYSGSNLQSYYASQRYQPRPNEAEQMMQAKRRMAAQRERELRNYHQEQQYNRSE